MINVIFIYGDGTRFFMTFKDITVMTDYISKCKQDDSLLSPECTVKQIKIEFKG
jgi:hypothetical protein